MSALAPYAKALGALLGGLTPAVVIGILALVHVTVDPTLAAALCAGLATLGSYLAPANKAKAADTPPAPAV